MSVSSFPVFPGLSFPFLFPNRIWLSDALFGVRFLKRGDSSTTGEMKNSPDTSETKTVLPDATREEQLKYWGIDASLRWDPEQKFRTPNDSNGWGVAYVKGGQQGPGGGLTTHRGVIHEDDFVDDAVLLEGVEALLGFTKAQVKSVYRQGPLSDEQRAMRDRIDATLLELQETGGNLTVLADALGLDVKDNGNCRVIENALVRAKAAR